MNKFLNIIETIAVVLVFKQTIHNLLAHNNSDDKTGFLAQLDFFRKSSRLLRAVFPMNKDCYAFANTQVYLFDMHSVHIPFGGDIENWCVA